jgi:hypothetical protein
MPISDKHNEYDIYGPQWRRIRDCIAGEDAVKASTTRHLPRPENMMPDQYDAYITRAMFYGATGRTLAGLSGAVFRKRPIVQIPDRLRDALTNITLTGVPFDTFAQRAVEETLALGRYGVLVDRPPEEDGRAYMRGYPAESICNWRTVTTNGSEKLEQIILSEKGTRVTDDGFGSDTYDRYRVLELDGEGYYHVRVFVEGRDVDTFILDEEYTPTKRGERLDYIPFQFFGPTDLSPNVEKSPLIDLANVNISHYRTSADLEQGNYLTSQPTPYITGMRADHAGDFPIGSGAMWLLPEGAQAGMLEYKGAGLTFLENSLSRKQGMMAQLGARLLEDQQRAVEAADTVRLRSSGESSVLANLANSCSMGLCQCLEWVTDWEGANPELVEVQLNTDFMDTRMEPPEMRELVAAWQSGAIPTDDLIYNLQRGEILRPDFTIEEVKDMLAGNETPVIGKALDLGDAADPATPIAAE